MNTKIASLLIVILGAVSSHAAYKDLIGFPELENAIGAGTLTGAGIEVQIIEATPSGGSNYYPGNSGSDPEFSGKTITNVTDDAGVTQGSTGTSSHAKRVAKNLYGNDTSIAPGISTIGSWEASHWMGWDGGTETASGFLNVNTTTEPDTTDARIANHSYIGGTSSDQLPRRTDYIVERDDFLQIVGIQNAGQSNIYPLWGTAFNVISVGRTNGGHFAGTLEIPSTSYTADRTAPHLVAPDTATSYATPIVSATTALLLQAGGANASWSNGNQITNRTRTIYHAETSEVIKATLMAGADRAVDNAHGDDLLASEYVVDTDNNLDLTYGAGQVNVFNSYNILAGGEQDPGGADITDHGWDYNGSFSNGDTAVYAFNAANSGDTLMATLAWNIEITDLYSNPLDPQWWPDDNGILDFNLLLVDVTGGHGTPDAVLSAASSQSSTENTENVFFENELIAGNRYELHVTENESQNFTWDYGLAWRVESVPEPSSAVIAIIGLVGFLGVRRWRV